MIGQRTTHVGLVGVIGIACAGLAACEGTTPREAPSAAAEPATWVYMCPDAFRFSVRLRVDSATIVLPAETATLPRVVAESGAKYQAQGITFWNKGQEATLETATGTHEGCTGVAAITAWEESRLLGVEFRALGQEPGWTLEIDQNHWIRYAGDYGNTLVSAVATEPAHDSAGAITFHAKTETHELTVIVRQAACQDVMSGEAFEYAAVLRVDGSELQGCGRMLHTGELKGVYWSLTELDGTPAMASSPGREAHLRLMAEGSQVEGSTGCNSMRGPYELSGDTLRFGPLAMTRMACVDPAMNEQEQRIVRMLGEVDRFILSADSLILFAVQRPRARFTAVYLR